MGKHKKNDIIRMCAGCKKIIDENDVWQVQDLPDKILAQLRISHSLCPGCLKELYPDIDSEQENETP